MRSITPCLRYIGQIYRACFYHVLESMVKLILGALQARFRVRQPSAWGDFTDYSLSASWLY
jgi:hypothetical protein